MRKPSGWFLFLVVAVPCLWGVAFWVQDWPLAVIAGCMSIYLVLDAWNWVKGMKAAREEPRDLK